MKQPHQEHELNQRWNTDKHRAAEPQPNSSPSRASRLCGESPAQDSPRSREEREDFAKKNPFLPAKDFRVSGTEQPSRNSGDLCSSVFICVHLCSSVFICGFVYDSIRRVISGFLPA